MQVPIVKGAYEELRLHDAVEGAMGIVDVGNRYVDSTAPWTALKKVCSFPSSCAHGRPHGHMGVGHGRAHGRRHGRMGVRMGVRASVHLAAQCSAGRVAHVCLSGLC